MLCDFVSDILKHKKNRVKLHKQKAFHEIWRVLKPSGDFIACFYIRGKSHRTDWLVKNILAWYISVV